MKNILFENVAFEDIAYWLKNEPRILKKIIQLLENIQQKQLQKYCEVPNFKTTF